METPVIVPAPATVTGEKPAWQSKTVWLSALTVLVPLVYPPAAVWIAANPALFPAALGLLFGGLRLVSHGKVTIT